MKVLHGVYSTYPAPPGGTEIYVTTLCHELRRQGVQSTVLAPGDRAEAFERDGIRTRTFVAEEPISLERLYGGEDSGSAAIFARVLEDEAPDVVHQHALSPALSGQLIRQAKARRLPVVFTYHTPTVSCQRGTLMEWGATPCDGRLDVERCTACSLHGLGAGSSTSRVLARIPDAGGRLLGAFGLEGGAWTALRMSSLLTVRHREIRTLLQLVDRFVVLTPWVGQVLRINGVPDERLTVSTHGVELPTSDVARSRQTTTTLRLAHLGRIDPTKGTALLIEAIRALPDADVSLDVYGVVQGAAGSELMEDSKRQAAEDRRITFLPAIPHEHVVATLATYDLLAVPSQWMETGPLVVPEAFAAGVPVLGSALGGIADKIRDGVDGLLVSPHDSVEAWRAAIERCHHDRELVRRLARGVSRPKSMTEVAREMSALYTDVVQGHRSHVLASAAAPLN